MIGLLQRVFGKSKAKPIPYDESKRLSASGNPAERRRVAEHDGVRPELLYFLANDPDPTVRAAVAANEATPVQADLLLARDRDGAVRKDLARKISRLAPGLSAQEHDRLRRNVRTRGQQHLHEPRIVAHALDLGHRVLGRHRETTRPARSRSSRPGTPRAANR